MGHRSNKHLIDGTVRAPERGPVFRRIQVGYQAKVREGFWNSQRWAAYRHQERLRDDPLRSPELPALLPGSGQASSYSFGDPGPFKLSDRRQDVHLELARWRGGVNAFSQTHKGNPKYLEFVE